MVKWSKTYWQQLPSVLRSNPKHTGNNCLQSCGITKWSKTYWQQLPSVLWHWEVIQNLLATTAFSPVALGSDPKPTGNNCLQSVGIVKWSKTHWQQLPSVLCHCEVIQNLLATISFSPVALWSDPNLLATIAFCLLALWSHQKKKNYWQQFPSVCWHCEITQNLLATTAFRPVALQSDPKPTGSNCLQSIQNWLATIAVSLLSLWSNPKLTGNNCCQSPGTPKWPKTDRQELPSVLWHCKVAINQLAMTVFSPVALQSDPKPTGNNIFRSCGTAKWSKNLLATIAFSPLALWTDLNAPHTCLHSIIIKYAY